MRFVSRGPEETHALAAKLARTLKGGEVLCFFGPLGSGKTTFIQGLAKALGCRDAASSPSFMLVREYRVRKPKKTGPAHLYHMDFYRVAVNELPNLGLEDYLADPRAVCLIEWAEAALAHLPTDRLELRFAYPDHGKDPGTRRVITLRSRGARSAALSRL